MPPDIFCALWPALTDLITHTHANTNPLAPSDAHTNTHTHKRGIMSLSQAHNQKYRVSNLTVVILQEIRICERADDMRIRADISWNVSTFRFVVKM